MKIENFKKPIWENVDHTVNSEPNNVFVQMNQLIQKYAYVGPDRNRRKQWCRRSLYSLMEIEKNIKYLTQAGVIFDEQSYEGRINLFNGYQKNGHQYQLLDSNHNWCDLIRTSASKNEKREPSYRMAVHVSTSFPLPHNNTFSVEQKYNYKKNQ
jgi:hypothetical protein